MRQTLMRGVCGAPFMLVWLMQTLPVANSLEGTRPSGVQCVKEGAIPDEASDTCATYYRCAVNSAQVLEPVLAQCPVSTIFSRELARCVDASAYVCGQRARERREAGFQCTVDGRFPNEAAVDCKSYYLCTKNTDGSLIAALVNCPSSTIFSAEKKSCVQSPPNICPYAPITTTSVPQSSTTLGPQTGPFVCPGEGRFVNEQSPDCTTYYLCLMINNKLVPQLSSCGSSLIFSASEKRCVSVDGYTCPKLTSPPTEVTSDITLTPPAGATTTTAATTSPSVTTPSTTTTGAEIEITTPTTKPTTTTTTTTTTTVAVSTETSTDTTTSTVSTSASDTTTNPTTTSEASTTGSIDITESTTDANSESSAETPTSTSSTPEASTTDSIDITDSTSSEASTSTTSVDITESTAESNVDPTTTTTPTTSNTESTADETTAEIPTTAQTSPAATTTTTTTETSTTINTEVTSVSSAMTTGGVVPTTTTVGPIVTTPSGDVYVCSAEGRYPDPNGASCESYILCIRNSLGTLTPIQFFCPPTTIFSVSVGLCVPASSHRCVTDTVTTTTLSPATSTTTTTPIITTPKPFVCPDTGRYPNPASIYCKSYYLCLYDGQLNLIGVELSCPSGSIFATDVYRCVPEGDYQCVLGSATTTVATTTTTPPPPPPTTTTTTTARVTTIGMAGACTGAGKFPSDQTDDCSTYQFCVQLPSGELVEFIFKCPGSTLFDEQKKTCSDRVVCTRAIN
uniref:Chitin-binding type-2 domain-containing protein n=1 Tax=Anopheles stephensi TaxID=30069 RepID=A0A182XXS0_ANOST